MTTIKEIYEFLMSVMGQLVLLLIGVALLAFLWGVPKYFKSYDNSKERAESTRFMVYGLLSLFVMTSLWGLVFMLGDSFGISWSYNNGDFNTSIDGSGNTGTNLFDTNLDDVPEQSLIDAFNNTNDADSSDFSDTELSDPSLIDTFNNDADSDGFSDIDSSNPLIDEFNDPN